MKEKDLLEKSEICQEKKTWVTPEIFDSPVITVTEGANVNQGADQSIYS